MGDKANTQSSLWLVYSASTTGNTGDRDTPHTMTKARSARRHSKAAARASSHLTPHSRPPSRLPRCQLGTHSPGAHTANAQALLHGSQNISVQEQGEARQLFPLSSSLGPNSLLSALSPHCLSPGGGRNYLLNRQKPPSPLCRSSGLSLSFPSQTRCFFVYSHAHHAHTYTHTHGHGPPHTWVCNNTNSNTNAENDNL